MSCGLRCVGTRRGIMANRKWVSTEVVRCRKCEFDDRERYVVVIAYRMGMSRCVVMVAALRASIAVPILEKVLVAQSYQ